MVFPWCWWKIREKTIYKHFFPFFFRNLELTLLSENCYFQKIVFTISVFFFASSHLNSLSPRDFIRKICKKSQFFSRFPSDIMETPFRPITFLGVISPRTPKDTPRGMTLPHQPTLLTVLCLLCPTRTWCPQHFIWEKKVLAIFCLFHHHPPQNSIFILNGTNSGDIYSSNTTYTIHST